MSAERQHHELGYSRWDKLNECLHFKGKPVGKAAKRGTDIHDEVEAIIKGGEAKSDVALKAAARIKRHLPKILSIEEQLPIIDEDFNEVAFGYADYVGRDEKGNLTVLDLKTGSQPAESYRLQLIGLAFSAMESRVEDLCKCVLVYADSDEDFVFWITKEEAKEIAWDLITRYQNKHQEAPQENSYCGWCANKATCPVYVKPVTALVAMDEAQAIKEAGFSREAILANPETASRFWSAYKKFTSLVEEWEVDTKLKEWISEGKEVPGYKIQNRKGRQSVDAEQVLLHVVKKMGAAKAAPFITVSASSLQKEWAAFTTEPLPVEITEGEATTSLVAAKGGK
jgi:RecB family exonuclease